MDSELLWGIADPSALAAELERDLAERRRYYPGMVAKGRMTQAEADYQLAIFAEIRRDLDVAFGPPPWILAAPRFAWADKVKALGRELDMRRTVYPDRVAKGRLTAEEATRRTATLEAIHDLYWRQMFGWPKPATDWLEAVRTHQAAIAATPQEAML